MRRDRLTVKRQDCESIKIKLLKKSNWTLKSIPRRQALDVREIITKQLFTNIIFFLFPTRWTRFEVFGVQPLRSQTSFSFLRDGRKKNWTWRSPLSSSANDCSGARRPYSSHSVCIRFFFWTGSRDFIDAWLAKRSLFKAGPETTWTQFVLTICTGTYLRAAYTHGTQPSSSSSDNHRYIISLSTWRQAYTYYSNYILLISFFNYYYFLLIILCFLYCRSCVLHCFWSPRRSLKTRKHRRNVATISVQQDPLWVNYFWYTCLRFGLFDRCKYHG